MADHLIIDNSRQGPSRLLEQISGRISAAHDPFGDWEPEANAAILQTAAWLRAQGDPEAHAWALCLEQEATFRPTLSPAAQAVLTAHEIGGLTAALRALADRFKRSKAIRAMADELEGFDGQQGGL